MIHCQTSVTFDCATPAKMGTELKQVLGIERNQRLVPLWAIRDDLDIVRPKRSEIQLLRLKRAPKQRELFPGKAHQGGCGAIDGHRMYSGHYHTAGLGI